MPELPEVETVRRQLEPEVVGRTIVRAEVLDERWTRPDPPRATEAALTGRRIEAVGRRGKYLIVALDDRAALVMHLRMTGNLLLRPAGSDAVADLMETERLGGPRLYESHPDARHLRARLELDDGSELWFTDARRFGHGTVLAGERIDEYFLARLGVEPLDGELTAEALCALAAGRRAPLKSFLLDQARIAGIGNIYADEALWRARLHPLSPAGSMKSEHCEALRAGIDAGRVPRPRPRGQGVRSLRRGHSAGGRLRPLDVLLPGLSEAAAGARAAQEGARVRRSSIGRRRTRPPLRR